METDRGTRGNEVALWYRDRAALSLIAKRYLPLLAVMNLAWEVAQLPLYTIWRDASAGYIAFAVLHCTAGDVLIGGAALTLALLATRARTPHRWPWLRVTVITAVIGATYTLASEWMNTSIRRSWEYSDLMPTLQLDGGVIGFAPLVQWLLLPPLVLYISRSSAYRRRA